MLYILYTATNSLFVYVHKHGGVFLLTINEFGQQL